MGRMDLTLDRIETATTVGAYALGGALGALTEATKGLGACLVVEHAALGEIVIADQHWSLGRDATLGRKEALAVVDFRDCASFQRVAVLVEGLGCDAELEQGGYDIAAAALDVVQALVGSAGAAVPEALCPVPGAELHKRVA